MFRFLRDAAPKFLSKVTFQNPRANGFNIYFNILSLLSVEQCQKPKFVTLAAGSIDHRSTVSKESNGCFTDSEAVFQGLFRPELQGIHKRGKLSAVENDHAECNCELIYDSLCHRRTKPPLRRPQKRALFPISNQ